MSPRFFQPIAAPLVRAQELAGKSGLVEEAHLFLSVLEIETDGVIAALLAVSGVSREEARLYAQSALESDPAKPQEPKLSRGAKQVLERAAREARLDHSPQIEPHHLFIACVSQRRGPHLGEVMRPLGLDAAQLRGHLRGLKTPQNLKNSPDKLTARAERAMEAAHAAMRASFCGRISVAHLLLGLLSDEENIAVETLQKANCDLESLRQRARQSIKSDGEIATPHKRFSPGAKRALERAASEAKAAGHRHIDCGYLLLGLLPQNETLSERWKARGRKLDSVDELWTAEEALALREALRGELVGVKSSAVHRDFRLTPPKSGLTAAQVWGLLGFTLGFLWGVVLFVSSQGNRSTPEFIVVICGMGVLVFSGLGTAVTRIFARSPRTKNIWASFFGGWIFGVLLAELLSRLFAM